MRSQYRVVVIGGGVVGVSVLYHLAKYGWTDLDATLIFGRQRIKLDDDRFIGNVGWRQNEQTFDALTFKTMAIGAAAKIKIQVAATASRSRDRPTAIKKSAKNNPRKGSISASTSWR